MPVIVRFPKSWIFRFKITVFQHMFYENFQRNSFKWEPIWNLTFAPLLFRISFKREIHSCVRGKCKRLENGQQNALQLIINIANQIILGKNVFSSSLFFPSQISLLPCSNNAPDSSVLSGTMFLVGSRRISVLFRRNRDGGSFSFSYRGQVQVERSPGTRSAASSFLFGFKLDSRPSRGSLRRVKDTLA